MTERTGLVIPPRARELIELRSLLEGRAAEYAAAEASFDVVAVSMLSA